MRSVQVLIELSQYGERPVSEAEGKATARRIGAESYIECSALTQHNLKQVFDVAVRAAVVRRARAKKHSKWCSGRNGHVVRNGVLASPVSDDTETAEPSRTMRSWKHSFCCWTWRCCSNCANAILWLIELYCLVRHSLRVDWIHVCLTVQLKHLVHRSVYLVSNSQVPWLLSDFSIYFQRMYFFSFHSMWLNLIRQFSSMWCCDNEQV